MWSTSLSVLWWAVLVGEVGLDSCQWGKYPLDVCLLVGCESFVWFAVGVVDLDVLVDFVRVDGYQEVTQKFFVQPGFVGLKAWTELVCHVVL